MKEPKEHRYYLLPGMGASNRRWHRRIRRWTLIVALFICAVVAIFLYIMNR
jgi:4-amino-4-deoxy-L-arabinose transferase-like glycosyltransferase